MQAGYLAHRIATPPHDNQSIRQLQENQLRFVLLRGAHALDFLRPIAVSSRKIFASRD
jgi:hypothetical protein